MDQFDKPARPDDGPDDGPDLALDDALRQWWCTWETGPDSGATFVLGAGRYLLGRAAGATLRCDDPALEAHHAELVVDHSGIRVAQLTGRLDLLVDGRAAEQHGSLTVIDGGQIEIGHSVLRCRSTGTEQPAAADLRNGTVLRGPRPEPLWRPVLLTPPAAVADRLEATGGLLPAVLGLVGSAAVAVAMRQPMFLIFGALGAMVAFGSWLAQRLGLVRRNRRGARSHRRDAQVFAVDVATGVGLALPAAPSFDQREASEAGHQVELARPRESARQWCEPDAIRTDTR
ncbi:MAG: FHA domain-containing protein, partial [Ilumatobacteraceae bacterium]